MEGLALPDDWLVLPASLMAGMACQSHPKTGLIQEKEEGWTGFSKGGQGYSEGFPEDEAQDKSQGAVLPA